MHMPMFFQINCIHFGFMSFYFNQMYTIARKHYIQTTLKWHVVQPLNKSVSKQFLLHLEYTSVQILVIIF